MEKMLLPAIFFISATVLILFDYFYVGLAFLMIGLFIYSEENEK